VVDAHAQSDDVDVPRRKPVDLDGERIKPLELASKKPLESPGIAPETYAPTKKPRREAGAFH
jgi:hypothetical protein